MNEFLEKDSKLNNLFNAGLNVKQRIEHEIDFLNNIEDEYNKKGELFPQSYREKRSILREKLTLVDERF